MTDSGCKTLTEFFSKAEVHQNRVLKPWELSLLFKNSPAIKTISNENLRQQIPFIIGKDATGFQYQRLINTFPLARSSEQIEKVVTNELKKYHFDKKSTIFFESTDPIKTDISQLLEHKWGKKI